MKIVFTGGGGGGHFYPVIAVIERCVEYIDKEKIVDAKLYYFAPTPDNKKMLFENGVTFVQVQAGKMRRYFSLWMPIDTLKTFIGVIKAFFSLWAVYPDVVFSKGGYGSFPTLFAAKLLRIPVVMHESDSVPGRTNIWTGKFAKKIALSYSEAASYFPKEKVAYTGQPVRKEILLPSTHGAFEYLNLDENVPTILILGGSLGAKIINESVLDIIPKLVEKYQVIHQAGERNLSEVEKTAGVILENNPNKSRYKVFGFLNDLALRMSAGASKIVITRAGSALFEIAAWGLPSIVIPISDSNGDHQRKNAYNYARSGSAIVIEEENLTSTVLDSEINKLMDNELLREKMSASAKLFYRQDAAETIAKELVNIALSHEK